MAVRFWWTDDSDSYVNGLRLEKLRTGQFKDWDWIKWFDDSKEDKLSTKKDESFLNLLCQIQTKSMFALGKVVYCYGVPKCHAKLINELDNIPENVLFIIIGKPNKTYKLYDKALEMQEQKLAKIDIHPEIPKERDGSPNKETYAWVSARAITLGASIEDTACRMLVGLVGININILTLEIQKLKIIADNGTISHWHVKKGCYGEGVADIRAMGAHIVAGENEYAKEIMRRLLTSGEPPLKICGYLMDWSRRLAIAESLSRNPDFINKEFIGSLKKRPEGQKSISILDFNEGRGYKDGDKLFANPGSLYYSVRDLAASNKYIGWPYDVLIEIGRLQIALRQGIKSQDILMMDFLEKICIDKPKG